MADLLNELVEKTSRVLAVRQLSYRVVIDGLLDDTTRRIVDALEMHVSKLLHSEASSGHKTAVFVIPFTYAQTIKRCAPDDFKKTDEITFDRTNDPIFPRHKFTCAVKFYSVRAATLVSAGYTEDHAMDRIHRAVANLYKCSTSNYTKIFRNKERGDYESIEIVFDWAAPTEAAVKRRVKEIIEDRGEHGIKKLLDRNSNNDQSSSVHAEVQPSKKKVKQEKKSE
tara:strand:+ start:184 stop:858 length:675 start_codon:yes stop_codon:yes gene_type:complete